MDCIPFWHPWPGFEEEPEDINSVYPHELCTVCHQPMPHKYDCANDDGYFDFSWGVWRQNPHHDGEGGEC